MSFDFYDDWEEEENEGLLGGWGRSSDGYDGGFGYGAVNQPGRQRGMSYGARTRDTRFNTGRRKSTAHHAHDTGLSDPTIIPSSSYFGFLGRLPFNIGGKGLRYRPSAADLVEHPGQGRRSLEEEEPLMEDSDEEGHGYGYTAQSHRRGMSEGKGKGVGMGPGHQRQRSHTTASGHTTDSLSSRGDIFPSEDDMDDAVPLDDEFTISLERRTTGTWGDEGSGSKKPPASRRRSSQRSRKSGESGRERKSTDEDLEILQGAGGIGGAAVMVDMDVDMHQHDTPTLSELKQEEERAQMEEEQEIMRKRERARSLALQRGLTGEGARSSSVDAKSPKSNGGVQQGTPGAANGFPRSSSSPHLAASVAVSSPSPGTLSAVPNGQPHKTAEVEYGDAIPGDTSTPAQAPVVSRPEEQPQSPQNGTFPPTEGPITSPPESEPVPTKPVKPLPAREGHVPASPQAKKPESDFVPARLPHFGPRE